MCPSWHPLEYFVRLCCLTDDEAASWRLKPVYVVGEGTAAAVSGLGFRAVGANTGNAERLSELIIQETPTPPPSDLSFLFLTGDKRSDVIFRRLGEKNLAITEVSVYATMPVSDFAPSLTAKVAAVGNPGWIVFFSPSGVDIALNACRTSNWWTNDVKVASIGPTTSARLRELGITVDAEAAKPGAAELAKSIAEALEE